LQSLETGKRARLGEAGKIKEFNEARQGAISRIMVKTGIVRVGMGYLDFQFVTGLNPTETAV
jgi:hypothetical protein